MNDDRYPHTCECGEPCYEGATKIECSNIHCSHWDGEVVDTKKEEVSPDPQLGPQTVSGSSTDVVGEARTKIVDFDGPIVVWDLLVKEEYKSWDLPVTYKTYSPKIRYEFTSPSANTGSQLSTFSIPEGQSPETMKKLEKHIQDFFKTPSDQEKHSESDLDWIVYAVDNASGRVGDPFILHGRYYAVRCSTFAFANTVDSALRSRRLWDVQLDTRLPDDIIEVEGTKGKIWIIVPDAPPKPHQPDRGTPSNA